MSLVSSLLEGYGNRGSNIGTPINCTPTEYINSSIIELVKESYGTIEEYNTASLIGMSKVLTEELDPTAVYESVFESFSMELCSTLAQFIGKFDTWRQMVTDASIKKISVMYDRTLTDRVNCAISGRDNDEMIVGLTFPYRQYNTESGLKKEGACLDILNRTFYDCVNFILGVISGKIQPNEQFDIAEAYRLDVVKSKLSDTLGCKSTDVVSCVASSFVDGAQDRTFSVMDIKDILSDRVRLEKAINTQIAEVDAMLSILNETKDKISNIVFDDKSPVNGDVLAVVMASMIHILSLEINILKVSIDNIFGEMDQNRNILMAFLSTYTNGTDCPVVEEYGLVDGIYEDFIMENVELVLGAAAVGVVLVCKGLSKKDQINLKKAIKLYEENGNPTVKFSSLKTSVYELDKAYRQTDKKLTGIKKFFNKNSRRAEVWETSSGEYICSNIQYTKVENVKTGLTVSSNGDVTPSTEVETKTYRLYDISPKYKKDSEYLCAAMSLADGVSNDNTVRFVEDIKKKYSKEFKDTKVKFFGKSLESVEEYNDYE